MDILTVHKLGPALIKALGAPPHCTWLELRLAYDEIPTVKCEYYPVGDDGTIDTTTKLLAEFELVRRPAPVVDEPEFLVEQHFAGAPGEEVFTVVTNFDAWMRARTDRAHAEYMAAHAAGGIAFT